MTKIKLCGLRRPCDIDYANALKPEYVGFVLTQNYRRSVAPGDLAPLRKKLHPEILPVGVFVDEPPDMIAALLKKGLITIVQLHGNETDAYIRQLRDMSDCTIIKAFRIET
ncbi:MAG: tryptophan synthase subunit beta, partial [Lachnospiraceae bacterium]